MPKHRAGRGFREFHLAEPFRLRAGSDSHLFALLVNAVTDYALYMIDPEGRVATWNPGAERSKGYKAEEIIGEHFSRFFTEEDRAAGLPERALRTAAAEGRFESEGWRLRKDGTRFWVNAVIDPIYDEKGGLLGFAKITRDMTERRRAQEELEEARNALFQSQKLQALGELTGGIAHDVNNLMTVIRGSADLLRRGELGPEKRRRYLDAIVETSERAAVLTSHLLAFSRRQSLRPQVLDINVRLDAIGEILGRTLSSPIDVRLELDPELWPAEVDPAELETALLNAAVNARDAMPEGGRLTITTSNRESTDGDFVCIALADTGVGMSDEVVDRAFEPFFTTKPVGKGTGLGLSQIHGFAAQSGGRAEIESRPGEGTTIRILLPRSHKQVPDAEAGRSMPATMPGLKVLLVEDNPHVLAFARHLLEDLQYEVIVAESGDVAMEILDAGEPVDLLFADVVMPGLSGVELAHAARRHRPHLPVVLATGYSDEILGGAGKDFEVLRKPYDPLTLGEAIVAAMKPREKAPAASVSP